MSFEIIGKAPNGQPLYRWTELDGSVWEDFMSFEIIGKAPNGQPLYRWTELDGSVWEDYWMPVPGGGLIQHREVT